MKVNKRILQAVALAMGVCMLCVGAQQKQPQIVQVEDEPCALSGSAGTVIEQTKADVAVIPDKYNTGCSGMLTEVEPGTTVNGIEFKTASEDTRNVLDFAYRNKEISGTVVFENYDFTSCAIWSYNEGSVDREIKLVFNNCKFSEVCVGKEDGNLSYEFNNCTFNYFNGSNATFNRCQFGKSYSDGMVPFRNIQVNDCLFWDMTGDEPTTKPEHTDGTQIYGYKGLDVENVYFTNCRFEMPPLNVEGSAAAINACIMLQLEFSNAKNVAFTDCIVNGGGYSIYAWDAEKGFTFENVKLSGISTGCAKSFGTMYPKVDSTILMEDIKETDALYVASVWKDGGNTHLSVTNDTNRERKLLVVTDAGQFEHIIPACPTGSEMNYSMAYEDMPFDLDIVIPADCGYVVCYDNTIEGYAKQVRFVNWTGESVCIASESVEELTAKGDEVLVSGSCGTNVTFSLTKAGVLTLSGSGSTEDYHSAKLPPWSEYVDYIQVIRVEEGIDKIGNQIFKNHGMTREISLPNSLTTIGTRAISGCTSLTTIVIPAGVVSMYDAVFAGTPLQKVLYAGSDWNVISLGTGNENLVNLVEYTNPQPEENVSDSIVMHGVCGDGVEYTLTVDGVLTISGEGETYNYHSGNPAPWYESRALITTVVVEEGIVKLGNQFLARSENVTSVKLPESLTVIGCNDFLGCLNLTEINIPGSVTEIHEYAFRGIGVATINYGGTAETWDLIDISQYNEGLDGTINFQ